MEAGTPETQPLEIDLDRRRELRIRWADGQLTVISLATLRRNCPCAGCRAERRERTRQRGGLPVLSAQAASPALTEVQSADLAGNYALRITWGDGHSTGIYDFVLLRSLATGDSAEQA